MTLNDRTRSRKTYSFFRSIPSPITVVTQTVSGSVMITWSDDLFGSTDTNQYVGSISGAGGSGATVAVNAPLDAKLNVLITGSLYAPSISGSIQRLVSGISYLAAGASISIVSASSGQIVISATSGSWADPGASYIVVGNTGSLSNERALTAGSGISITDNGANSTIVISATGGGGGADPGASYIVAGLTSSLGNERVLTAGTGISITDNGANNTIVISSTGGATGSVLWNNDLSGSTATNQYVKSISGAGGLGGTVPVSASVLDFSATGNIIGRPTLTIYGTSATYVGSTLYGFGNSLISGDSWISFNGTNNINITNGKNTLGVPLLEFGSSLTAPTIYQAQAAEGGGQALTVQAQNATAGTSTGGNLLLYAGNGGGDTTGTSGSIQLGTGNGKWWTINGNLTGSLQYYHNSSDTASTNARINFTSGSNVLIGARTSGGADSKIIQWSGADLTLGDMSNTSNMILYSAGTNYMYGLGGLYYAGIGGGAAWYWGLSTAQFFTGDNTVIQNYGLGPGGQSMSLRASWGIADNGGDLKLQAGGKAVGGIDGNITFETYDASAVNYELLRVVGHNISGTILYSSGALKPGMLQTIHPTGRGTNMVFRAQAAAAGRGGNIMLEGGSGSVGAQQGSVQMILKSQPTLEVAALDAARRVVVFGLGTPVTSSHMPAGTGDQVIYIANAALVPSASAVGGGILYVEAGALKYRGTAGTVTTLGPA